jgi:hypothetical protein
MAHCLGLVEAVLEFINVVAMGGKAYAKGAAACLVTVTLDGCRGGIAVA